MKKYLTSKTFLFFLLLLSFVSSTNAQLYFFGRNKVQYEKFEWKILRTENFDIYYYDDLDEIARIGAYHAEEAYKKLQVDFNNVITRRIPLIFYNTHLHFQQTNVTPGFIPEGVGGFFEFMKGRVVIPFAGDLSQFRHVIRHEMVHVAMMNKLFRIKTDHRLPAEAQPPLWFIEGIAEFLSTEWDAQAEMVLRDAVLNNYFVGIQEMYKIHGTFLMYKVGQAFLEYVAEKYGEQKVTQMIDNVWMFTSFNKVIEFTLGKTLEEIDKEWMEYVKKKYYPLLKDFSMISAESEMITEDGFNFSPAFYKKDEKEFIYYIANRNGYASLYRVEIIENGKKFSSPEIVVQGEKTEDLESFHLLQKSLAISKEGIAAFVSKSGPTNVIHFYSIEEDEIISTFRKDYLISIKSPSFSSDGKRLVFEAIDNKGFSDLFVLNIETMNEERLTNDYFNDKDPIFGRNDLEIIFSSDRTAGTNKGVYNLFNFNLADYRIGYITNLSFNTTAPQLNPDKTSLIFCSEIDGVDNVWKLSITETGFENIIYRVTKFVTAPFYPQFIDSSRIVFSGFEKFSFKLYSHEIKNYSDSIDIKYFNFENTEGKWLADFLPAASHKEEVEYEKEFSLDYAQSQVSTDPVFGTRGGAVFSLSDMLSDDNYLFLIYNTAEVQDDFLQSFNVSVTRLSLKERSNFGYGIFHYRGRRYDIRDSDEYFFERSFGGFFVLNFPLSTFARLEASMTVSNSDKQILTGVLERKALLWSNNVSYVFDNSIWASTGPIDGRRFRLLLGYTTDVKFSNVNYYSVIADYREYIRLGLRSAIAFRSSLYYNEGKEARRYFMGGSWDLRGWPRWSIRGEKQWVSSLEVRFPLIDQIRIKFPFIDLGFSGLRGALFVDGGGSWDRKYTESIGSIGGGLRFNIFGVLVLRYDIGKTIQEDFSKLQEGLFYQFFFGWDF
ncbi:MAG: hypothetical protein C0425_00045 [Chlorobiaceae bacterium]|nr:hypothetical protein [Chlorobiaceae bacterium]MBA4308713.1 hypothetical protein [Chlorobiaceae bacterium]